MDMTPEEWTNQAVETLSKLVEEYHGDVLPALYDQINSSQRVSNRTEALAHSLDRAAQDAFSLRGALSKVAVELPVLPADQVSFLELVRQARVVVVHDRVCIVVNKMRGRRMGKDYLPLTSDMRHLYEQLVHRRIITAASPGVPAQIDEFFQAR